VAFLGVRLDSGLLKAVSLAQGVIVSVMLLQTMSIEDKLKTGLHDALSTERVASLTHMSFYAAAVHQTSHIGVGLRIGMPDLAPQLLFRVPEEPNLAHEAHAHAHSAYDAAAGSPRAAPGASYVPRLFTHFIHDSLHGSFSEGADAKPTTDQEGLSYAEDLWFMVVDFLSLLQTVLSYLLMPLGLVWSGVVWLCGVVYSYALQPVVSYTFSHPLLSQLYDAARSTLTCAGEGEAARCILHVVLPSTALLWTSVVVCAYILVSILV
jgi:hypothetical protein